jgi:hypothetical protein
LEGLVLERFELDDIDVSDIGAEMKMLMVLMGWFAMSWKMHW